MMRLSDGDPCGSEEGLRWALAECGCDARDVERCAACACEGRFDDELRLLASKRRALMDELHAAQVKVDRLDYVIRAVESNGSEAGETP